MQMLQNTKEQDGKMIVHKKAFSTIICYLKGKVIGKTEVVQLSSLTNKYVQELDTCGYPSDYRSEKLKV